MKKYPKIGIRPTIDGRQGGVRESLEEKTMNLAKAVAELISSNLKNGDGSPVRRVQNEEFFPLHLRECCYRPNPVRHVHKCRMQEVLFVRVLPILLQDILLPDALFH